MDLQPRAVRVRHDGAVADEEPRVAPVARDFEHGPHIDQLEVAGDDRNLARPGLGELDQDLALLQAYRPMRPAADCERGVAVHHHPVAPAERYRATLAGPRAVLGRHE